MFGASLTGDARVVIIQGTSVSVDVVVAAAAGSARADTAADDDDDD